MMKKLFQKILGKTYIGLLKYTSATTQNVPEFRFHLSEQAVGVADNYVASVIKFKGIAFEAISESHLENDFDALNLVYAETAKENAGRLAFCNYFLRRKIDVRTKYKFDNDFCQNFADKYLQRFNETDYFENRFYTVLVLKFDEDEDEAVRELEAITNRFCQTLSKYDPTVLQAYDNGAGVPCSEVFEFLYEIINSEPSYADVPLTASPAYEILPQSNLHFGYDLLQVKGVESDKFASMWDLKDFPRDTTLGMFNSASLSLPFEYNLVHSFVSMPAVKAIDNIQKRQNRLLATQDKALHEQEDLQKAQGYVQSGELAFGEYHASLVVFGNDKRQAIKNGVEATASFANNAGAVFRKASGSAPATYFSQLPLYKYKPRPMMKSSRNLAGVFSMHNYSRGKAKGNPLGDGSAIMPLETVSKTLYDFNFHFTNENEDNIGEMIAGHTLILGATGTGKTTLQSALLAFLQRFNPAMFALDKDRSMDIFIRALDGDYFAIQKGEPTGINPFQFEQTPQLKDFLYKLVETCATDKNMPCTSEEKNQIKFAVDAVLKLDYEDRRMSAILQQLYDDGGNCLFQRLLKWCNTVEYGEGTYAWALDNPFNQFDPNSFKIVGFDVGAILQEDYQPTEPLLACLLYLKEQMVKNYDIIATVVEEFWLPLKYKTPQEMMLDILKTGRKRGEILIPVSQSPEEAINSEIFPALVQQTPTKILLPNPDAEYKNEQGGGYSRIGLTEKEFDRLKSLTLDSRTFLVKQGQQSSFAKLNLYGFSKEIAVLSSTKANVYLLDDIYRELAKQNKKAKSKDWLPIFYECIDHRKKYGVDNLPALIEEQVSNLELVA